MPIITTTITVHLLLVIVVIVIFLVIIYHGLLLSYVFLQVDTETKERALRDFHLRN